MVENRTADILTEWESSKPVQGAQKPDQALHAISGWFQRKVSKDKCCAGDSSDNFVNCA